MNVLDFYAEKSREKKIPLLNNLGPPGPRSYVRSDVAGPRNFGECKKKTHTHTQICVYTKRLGQLVIYTNLHIFKLLSDLYPQKSLQSYLIHDCPKNQWDRNTARCITGKICLFTSSYIGFCDEFGHQLACASLTFQVLQCVTKHICDH